MRVIGRHRGLWRGSGSPLPRSFKPHGHEKQVCGAFYGLLIAHGSLNTLFVENGRSGLFRAFPEVAFTLLQNLVGDCIGFGQLPRPSRWLGPGQSDALLQGLLRVQ